MHTNRHVDDVEVYRSQIFVRHKGWIDAGHRYSGLHYDTDNLADRATWDNEYADVHRMTLSIFIDNWESLRDFDRIRADLKPTDYHDHRSITVRLLMEKVTKESLRMANEVNKTFHIGTVEIGWHVALSDIKIEGLHCVGPCAFPECVWNNLASFWVDGNPDGMAQGCIYYHPVCAKCKHGWIRAYDDMPGYEESIIPMQ